MHAKEDIAKVEYIYSFLFKESTHFPVDGFHPDIHTSSFLEFDNHYEY